MFRKSLLYCYYLLCGGIDFIVVYVTLAVTLPYIRLNADRKPVEKGVVIYVQSNGVHTDFVLPVKTAGMNWNTLFDCSDFKNVDTTFGYVSIGWGDKGFFIATPTWADLKASTVLNAAFGLSTTAMHVTYRRYRPERSRSCRQLTISEEQYGKLTRYISDSFQQRASRFLLIDHPGYTGRDRFYEANGTYSLVNTCNVWTGEGLEAIGARTGFWTPFSQGVLQNLD